MVCTIREACSLAETGCHVHKFYVTICEYLMQIDFGKKCMRKHI